MTHDGARSRVYGYGTRKKLSFSLGQHTRYFRQKCMPLRTRQQRIQTKAMKTETSIF
jgi:hypothetical protein